MPADAALIDRIVAGVLGQLGQGEVVSGLTLVGEKVITETRRHAEEEARGTRPEARVVEIEERVVTAAVLEGVLGEGTTVVVPAKAIITPAARDVAKEAGIQIQQRDKSQKLTNQKPTSNAPLSTLNSHLLIVVRTTDAVERLCEQRKDTWRREWTSCPDDAAKLASSEISRGGTATVVILAEQTHRAACLANRNAKVKAAAIRDANDVRIVQKQIRTNVWCLDPAESSWFELKRLFDVLTPKP